MQVTSSLSPTLVSSLIQKQTTTCSLADLFPRGKGRDRLFFSFVLICFVRLQRLRGHFITCFSYSTAAPLVPVFIQAFNMYYFYMYAYMHACMYAYMHVCMCICMYACMYAFGYSVIHLFHFHLHSPLLFPPPYHRQPF